ncbi:bifunctional non-homologous end joining protein LigD [Nannocystis exedens]|uniref:DNA ligase (ATP) n=1 Tax=Nannocystis exedens TaxID=54 RepID=A0A1I2DDU2_9BACT|nr:DNA ligase D [Nannocystis exedens]PCC70597.1 DNA ligase [Nannocystis exedens]SFE78120.1 bifunctional non-homologous end joining protein LigD [Nannocystis exedens]
MSLARYHQKRDFAVTPEPRGKAPKSGSQGEFIIHKHAARRLHYDIRLELDGVLKSWACPKGPSLDPHDKRLAVHVEDHPLEYGDFEGTIPQGEYGGGSVILWDRGRWYPEGDARAGYRAGKLKFRFDGHKLQGSYTLVRMHGRRDDDTDNWLLIKERDEVASDDGEALVRDQPESILSGRTVEEVAAGEPPKKKARKTTNKQAKGKPSNKSTRRPAGNKPARSDAANAAVKAVAKKPAAKKKKSAKKRSASDEPARLPTAKQATKKTATKKAAKKTTKRPRAAKKKSTKKAAATAKKSASERPLPERVAPELATLVDNVPPGDDWCHEIKFDGYRLLARVDEGDVRLITRGEQDWTERLAPLARSLQGRLGDHRALVDGELVHVDEDGLTRFGPLQAALAENRPGELVFYAFDLLHLDGHDLRGLPLIERKKLLAELLPPEDAPGRVRLSEHIVGGGEELLARACSLGLEGILAKRADAPYKSGRTRDWLKIKCGRRQEVVVGGYATARSGPRALGALLVGVFDDDGKLQYAGKVGTGFDFAEAARLHKLLSAREVARSPFAGRLPTGLGDVHFVRPDVVVEVRFGEWTRDDRIRHAVYEGVREDKRPKQVHREAPAPTPDSAGVEVLGVPLSNPGRVLWPDDDITKRDLAEYYEKIVDWILPHVADRPLSLVRCPDGIGKPCFFQRHMKHDLPDGIQAIEIGDEDEPAYVYVRDARGLIGLAQIGALELHAWGATVADPDGPDRLVLDLDPAEDVPWDLVKGAAKAMRERLARIDLDSFLKTTGGKGLHVVVPLTAGRQSWAEVKAFARGIAREFSLADPEHFVDVAAKHKRRGKIYVDYLRNDRGATSVAAYSPRARPGASVSVPLRWSELAGLADPKAYDMDSTVARLAKLRSDPWRELARVRQVLTAQRLRAVGAKV